MTKKSVACSVVLGSLLTVGACALPVGPDGETDDVESEAKVVPHVTVAHVGTGDGTVVSSDGALDCGSVCTAGIKAGTTVTLNASPRYDSRFVATRTRPRRRTSSRSRASVMASSGRT